MSDLQAIADRVEIEALRGEYTDAAMMRDYVRFASLFTEDGAMRWPHINKEFLGRDEIRAAVEQGQGLWDYFVQTTHPGTIQIGGDTATGRAYIAEFGRLREGSSHLNYAVYHDRTPTGGSSPSASTRSSTSTPLRWQARRLTHLRVRDDP